MLRLRRLLFALLFLVACFSSEAAERQWHSEKGFRWAELKVEANGKTGFTLLAPPQTGIFFTNELDELKSASNRVLQAGSGVAIGDFDGDGLPDIYFCNLAGHNALYKNLGNWKFTNVTAGSGIVCTNDNYRGAVFADVNGDGWLDLLITTTGAGVLCFTNDGHGKFADATSFAGTATKLGSVTLALADVDGNGTLDLYVVNYRTDDVRDHGQLDLQMVGGQLTVPPALKNRFVVVDGRVLEYGEPDQLYLNDGNGHFTPVSWTNGAFQNEEGKSLSGPPMDWGLGGMFRDFNGDGAPDLYICNDYWSPDRIWINDGKGHFRAAPKLAFRHTSASSMGVDFADVNRSGNVDCFVVDMLSRDHRLRKRQMLAQTPLPSAIGEIDTRPQVMRNTFFMNRGDGTFAEIADYAGVSASEWAWQPIFLDVDLDGYEDVLISTGHVKDVQDLDANLAIRDKQPPRGKPNDIVEFNGKKITVREAFIAQKLINSRYYPRLETPIVAFHNRGGYRFEEKTSDWGLNTPGIHHGIALADFDGDGALDAVVNNLGSAAGVYRNNSSAARVAVRLKGTSPNTQGIGAKIKLLGGAVPTQSQEIINGGRYMSGSEPMLAFAAGKSAGNMAIEVTWRSGRVSRVGNVAANRIYEVDEAGSIDEPKAVTAAPLALFKDVSARINHTHAESAFNDFERQPLLPKKLSQLGPGIAWFDVDGDGHDDLILGNGRDGTISLFRGDGKGGFSPMPAPAGLNLPDDATGIVGCAQLEKRSLLVGVANYEQPSPAAVFEITANAAGATATELLPQNNSSTGPLALADVDGDGDLDLFIGGRVVAGRFPEPASSRVFRFDGTRFQYDAENSRVLKNAGLVSGAVWSDLDGDGFAELILACEWGPIRVFKNEKGKLREITAELGLDKFTGWWNSVTAGDIDGDGRLDIIAGNWGLNTPWHASPENPARIFYGDFGGAGSVDLIEAETDPDTGKVAPIRMLNSLAASMPFLRASFPTYKAYSEASVADLLGGRLATEIRATTLASMLFLNRSNGFESIELPLEAQLAPVFSINVADVDGDGHEDVFLSQNFFDTRPDVPRLDAGRGVWLRGDGTGKLTPLPAANSGIALYGEQRGAALCDFNEDGRVDLAVTQNGAATRLFENVGARPGLRVKLIGPSGNPDGVGAVIRVESNSRAGAAREVHAGAGYWSQDSVVNVMAAPASPARISVRWPGGKSGSAEIPANANRVSVRWSN
jgi:hypothetical protein